MDAEVIDSDGVVFGYSGSCLVRSTLFVSGIGLSSVMVVLYESDGGIVGRDVGKLLGDVMDVASVVSGMDVILDGSEVVAKFAWIGLMKMGDENKNRSRRNTIFE